MVKIKTGIYTEKEIQEYDNKQALRVIGKEEYFSVKNIMEWLPVKATTIKKYLQQGRIHGRKIGKTWYVSKENFYNYLEGK